MTKRILAGLLLVIPLLADAQIRQMLDAEPSLSRRAQIKAVEIAKATPTLARTARANGLEVQIVSARDGGNGVLEVFVKAWQGGEQIGFGDGSIEIERIRMHNPPIYVPDPAGTYERVSPEGVTLRYREDLREAMLQRVEHVLKVHQRKTVGSKTIVRGKVGNTISTFQPNAGSSTAPLDGVLFRSGVDELFGTIIAGAGTNVSMTSVIDTVDLDSRNPTSANSYKQLNRIGYGFDTASIPDGDTINSATLSLFGTTNTLTDLGSDSYGIVSFTPANSSSWAASDFSNFGGTDFATRISDASWSTSAYNDYTLNASGLAAINVTGLTHFGLRHGWDIDATFGGSYVKGRTRISVIMADTTGTTQDPLFSVDHSGASTGTPPAHVIIH